jgi:hypothetical protein
MKLEQEIQDELRSHLEMRTAENIAAGMTPEQVNVLLFCDSEILPR